jgi:hypothetical protein
MHVIAEATLTGWTTSAQEAHMREFLSVMVDDDSRTVRAG